MENGTRIPEFVIGNLRNGSYKFVGNKANLLQNGSGSIYHELRLLHKSEIRWPSGSSKVPVSYPECGFTGTSCYQEKENPGKNLAFFFEWITFYFAFENLDFRKIMIIIQLASFNKAIKIKMYFLYQKDLLFLSTRAIFKSISLKTMQVIYGQTSWLFFLIYLGSKITDFLSLWHHFSWYDNDDT